MPVNSPEPASELVTEEYVDPKYSRPYLEVNEMRDDPVPHRYIHGGFEESDARFSLYFPSAEFYEGRFFHNTYPMALTSDIGPFPIAFDVAKGDLGFTFDSGAYYVQTNLGGVDRIPPADPAIGAYRVNAAAAKYSRVIAAELYGDHRPFGYLFGGSGGSYQVMGAAENTAGVWDGFLPYVLGSPNSIPSMFTVRMHALRVLRRRDKFPGVMDAINPGGRGDPYAGLDDEEHAALKEATLLGYPLRGWWNYETLTSGYFSNVADRVPIMDPSYVTDFWSEPGYLGGDPASSIHAARRVFDTTVAAVIDSFPMQMELTGVPDWDITNAHLVFMSGTSAGKSVPVAWVTGTTVGFAYSTNPALLHSVASGEQLRIDNSWPLALETFQRHQVPAPDMYGWNQFRGVDGEPIYPQRGVLVGLEATANTVGSMPDGHITAKMLVIEVLMDIDAGRLVPLCGQAGAGSALRGSVCALVHRPRAARRPGHHRRTCPRRELRGRPAAGIARPQRMGRARHQATGHRLRGRRHAGPCPRGGPRSQRHSAGHRAHGQRWRAGRGRGRRAGDVRRHHRGSAGFRSGDRGGMGLRRRRDLPGHRGGEDAAAEGCAVNHPRLWQTRHLLRGPARGFAATGRPPDTLWTSAEPGPGAGRRPLRQDSRELTQGPRTNPVRRVDRPDLGRR
jgi:hypothetical protein